MTEALVGARPWRDAERREFPAAAFPGKSNGKSAQAADAFLHERRIILRRVAEYGLPDALRMTIGTEEENRAVLDALARLHGHERRARR